MGGTLDHANADDDAPSEGYPFDRDLTDVVDSVAGWVLAVRQRWGL